MTDEKTLPRMVYGTAWKEDRTEALVTQAIDCGFRAIDTANQRRHYYEEGVGKAIAKALAKDLQRKDLFIQTKFTFAGGQDHRIPYEIKANYGTQVQQSFESSLEHLQLKHIDSYVLHGPLTGNSWTEGDRETWQAMEALVKTGKVKYLGASNINLRQLQALHEEANIKPTFVQNRCFARQGWDKEVREYCRAKGMTYQGFSLLTANPFMLPLVHNIAKRVQKTPAQVLFRFSKDVGMLPLTGTTNPMHMKEDLDLNFTLSDEEVEFIETCGQS